jgi:hypothetical protein
MAQGQFKAIEDMAEATLKIAAEALQGDSHALDSSNIYLLWDGNTISRHPIIPEVISEAQSVSQEDLLSAEIEAVLGVLSEWGLPGFSCIHKSPTTSWFYYLVCLLSVPNPVSGCAKFCWDEGQSDIVKLTLEHEDWLHLQRTFFSASCFRTTDPKDIRVLPVR